MFWENISQINLIFQSFGEWLFYPMRFFSFLGDEEFYLFIMPFIFWCVDSRLGLKLGMILMLSNGVNASFKFLFHSPRPFWVNQEITAYVHESSFGLPSGHAQNAVSIWGYLSTLFRNKWIKTLFFVIFILIGISRLYLGAHFILDVLVGWILGGLLVLLFVFIEKKFEKRIVKWSDIKKISMAALVSVLIILLPVILKIINQNWSFQNEYLANINRVFAGEIPNPFSIDGVITASAAWLGLIIGIVIISKTIPLGKINSSPEQKFLRFLIGLLGVLLFYVGLKLVFPENIPVLSEMLRFIRYFLIGIWISAGAPYIFKRIGV